MWLTQKCMIDSCANNRDYAEMLQAVADGKITGLDVLITRRIPFEDFIEKGINALINEKDEHGSSSLSICVRILTEFSTYVY